MKKILAKKLAEVYAFSKLSSDTFQKGKEALSHVFDPEYIEGVIKTNNETAQTIEDLMPAYSQKSQFEETIMETKEKITKMREIYLEDNWGEADEVMEWLGFVEGSASVHWSLVEQLSSDENIAEIDALAIKMQEFHKELFQKIFNSIKDSE